MYDPKREEWHTLPNEYHEQEVLERLRARLSISAIPAYYGPGSLWDDMLEAVDELERFERCKTRLNELEGVMATVVNWYEAEVSGRSVDIGAARESLMRLVEARQGQL